MKIFNHFILNLMVFLISGVFALQPNPHPQPPFNCGNPAPNTCSFYKDCLGTKCGFNGYQRDYGYKYCNKFSNLKRKRKLTPDGQKWVTATMLCLQQSLVSVDCPKIHDVGFNSHARCYVHNGIKSICEIPCDWAEIVGTVSFKDLIGSLDSIKEVFKTGGSCLSLYYLIIKKEFKGVKGIEKELKDIEKVLKDIGKDIKCIGKDIIDKIGDIFD